jgi:hypothetical protein
MNTKRRLEWSYERKRLSDFFDTELWRTCAFMISVIPLLPERYRKDRITNAPWPCHKTITVFPEYNNPSEDGIKAVVFADPPRKVIE